MDDKLDLDNIPILDEDETDKMFKTPNIFQRIRRKIRFFIQRNTRGWDDSETWNLDYTIAKFILPRLKRFKLLANGYPAEFDNIDEWYEIIDKMIEAFECILSDDYYDLRYTEEFEAKINEGLDLFRKYYRNLWW